MIFHLNLQVAAGAVFRLTRFSLADFPCETWFQTEILAKATWVGGWGQILILILFSEDLAEPYIQCHVDGHTSLILENGGLL